jgi:protein TonB
LLNLSGHLDLEQPQSVLRVFDVTEAPPPPPPVQPEQAKPIPKRSAGASSPRNIRSQATQVAAPKPRIALPVPVPVATSTTPNRGAEATQGASNAAGPGTGAGGAGTGTGSGGSGSGSGGGGEGGYVVPPHLLTPDLRGRDFPRQLLDQWPAGAQIFVRIRVSPTGTVAECIIDRGTGDAAIDSTVCNLIHDRFRYSPARNRNGEAVAGWSGYRQVPPR